MTKQQSDTAILTAALLTAGVWGYRKLFEPHIGEGKTPTSELKALSGAEATPATAGQFAVGWGFVFLTLSLVNESSPDLAGSGAMLISVGYLLANGTAVFNDIQKQAKTPSELQTGEGKGAIKLAQMVASAPKQTSAPAAPGVIVPGGKLPELTPLGGS